MDRKIEQINTKEELISLLRSFNSNYLSRKTLKKYFKMADRFTEEEERTFFRMLPFDRTDCVSINDFVDVLYD